MIDTESASLRLRERMINLERKELLISKLSGSSQEKDITLGANCDGLGRIRHFRPETTTPWPANPLPIGPASRSLNLPRLASGTVAQLFQNAGCNWRCWYCYVPFDLLNANETKSAWVSAEKMVDLWQSQPDPPRILVLSGGQPDIVPEWVVWTMRAIKERGLEQSAYLWSDDNLSTDYLWRYLADEDIDLLSSYHNYGRAVCFKGFDPDSFGFNTAADPELYWKQFDLCRRLVATGLDTYAYVTLTNRSALHTISDKIKTFVDQLQAVHEFLPLRTIPLEVREFSPVTSRMNDHHIKSMNLQISAVEAWNTELVSRFDSRDLAEGYACSVRG